MRGERRVAVCASICALVLAWDLARAGEGEISADMAGRWQLHAPSGTYCLLEFSGSADIPHGISPTDAWAKLRAASLNHDCRARQFCPPYEL
jgi:hypothetical protein